MLACCYQRLRQRLTYAKTGVGTYHYDSESPHRLAATTHNNVITTYKYDANGNSTTSSINGVRSCL